MRTPTIPDANAKKMSFLGSGRLESSKSQKVSQMSVGIKLKKNAAIADSVPERKGSIQVF